MTPESSAAPASPVTGVGGVSVRPRETAYPQANAHLRSQ
jgi:hypothetical protein